MPTIMDNSFIQSIAGIPRWTVSCEKKPLDIWKLFDFGITVGAGQPDELYLCTLHELVNRIPPLLDRQSLCAKNAPLTYWCAATESSFCVLDIEKECPEDVRNELLRLPYLYGEYSSSGKGIHLVMSLPTYYMDYPIAMQKPALKEPHKWYEILLNHYSIFTGNLLNKPSNPDGDGDWDKVFHELAVTAKSSAYNGFDIDMSSLDAIPPAIKDAIINALIKHGKTYKKTLADFNNDCSSYEFGFMGYLYHKLNFITNGTNNMRAVAFDNSAKALLMYTAAIEVLPYRSKHDDLRDGLPWLLFEAREAVAKSDEKDKEKEGSKK